ncbi:hypothetical protein [Clostridium folliculivorans]|uniref:DUF4476 domain-containing protein n=1 Tax=Clostridium folliculivorans TaxID=2886038 RepID=A0A9W6D8W6_9CLOT|nr:hypothetical protein [Clostridium folliculivorans]GKU23326.1 hypothetical protein CFOLD11_01520 [Clostridium folliculivorans]GKU29443.1 hypothetical protein CFB3_15490 [Clostridium folliculivorans]
MNKKQKIYSWIVVFITLISVEVMVVNYKYDYKKLQVSSKQDLTSKQSGIKKEKQPTQNNQANKQSSDKLNSQSETKINTNIDSSAKIDVDLNKQNVSSNGSELENKYNDYVNKEDNYDSGIFDEESVPTVSIFKIDKNTIINRIGMADKAKLIYLSRKLSITDYDNIQEDLKSSNEIEASKDIFTILKKKLSYSDYEKVKNILSPYINVDYIENSIGN